MLNIYKILLVDSLKNQLECEGYKKSNSLKIGSLNMDLFYNNIKDRDIKWKQVFDFFDEKIDLNLKDIRGLILIEKNSNYYAITFGNSSFTVQKYCDIDFGFELARRIELKELKRKSTKSNRTRGKSSEIYTYVNEKTLDIESVDPFTSLSFTPVDDFFGKRIDFGKSIKLNLNLDFYKLEELLDKLENIYNGNEIKNKIPFLSKIQDDELIKEYNKYLIDFLKNIKKEKATNLNIRFDEVSIIGSSIYFENDFLKEIKYYKSMEIDDLDLPELFKFCDKYDISLDDLVFNGKIVFYDLNKTPLYTEKIYKFISFDIPEKKVSLFEGSWYEYNLDFIELIQQRVKTIKIDHNKEYDNISSKINGTYGRYKEEKIINYLCTKLSAKSIDRELFIIPYENEVIENQFKIELADMIIDNSEYCSLKQGDTKAFNYCFDQSELAAQIMLSNTYSGIIPKCISVWLFMKNIPKNKFNEVDLTAINSIMLQRKIALWDLELKNLNFDHIIRINKL